MKILLCFGMVLVLILPLYNVQRRDLLAVEGISRIYLVESVDGKHEYIEKELEQISVASLSRSDGLVLIFDSKNAQEVSENLQIKLVKEESIDNMKIIYGYTTLYSDFIYIDGKQSNVQIV